MVPGQPLAVNTAVRPYLDVPDYIDYMVTWMFGRMRG